MTRTTLTLPQKLKAKAEREARRQGVSLEQFIRESVERNLEGSAATQRTPHPFFDDPFVIEDDGPTDLAENHDRYLEMSLAEEHRRQAPPKGRRSRGGRAGRAS